MPHPAHPRSRILRALALSVAIALAAPALAGPREQARRMHDRLVGIPPDEATLSSMAAKIQGGDALGAADEAMQNPVFYNSTLKNFITPWTNVDRTVFAPLNDYTATVIGFIRDDRRFDEILTADLVYLGAPGVVQSPYSQTNNDHYQQLEERRVDLSDPSLLVSQPQSTLPGSQIGPEDAAGIITTRAAGQAFFSAGTNRRMWRFLNINFLCRDMEAMKDVSRPADRIRQDVDRSPGGDSSLYHNQCSGCHSGMDALAGAFAYFEWNADQQRVVHTPGVVQPKYLINADHFPGGYVTVDDSWVNFWRSGPNSTLGWRGPAASGVGPKSLGVEVASSRAFSECQVQKVFEQVCFRPPTSTEDLAEVQRISDVFEAQNYSMKRVFAETAVYCMGN
jgi:hypothetical protein